MVSVEALRLQAQLNKIANEVADANAKMERVLARPGMREKVARAITRGTIVALQKKPLTLGTWVIDWAIDGVTGLVNTNIDTAQDILLGKNIGASAGARESLENMPPVVKRQKEEGKITADEAANLTARIEGEQASITRTLATTAKAVAQKVADEIPAPSKIWEKLMMFYKIYAGMMVVGLVVSGVVVYYYIKKGGIGVGIPIAPGVTARV